MTTIYDPPRDIESLLYDLAKLLAYHAQCKVEISVERGPDDRHTKVLDYRRYQKVPTQEQTR